MNQAILGLLLVAFAAAILGAMYFYFSPYQACLRDMQAQHQQDPATRCRIAVGTLPVKANLGDFWPDRTQPPPAPAH